MSKSVASTQALTKSNWQTVNEDTGEVILAYKYLPGSPKNYRFDGRTGDFKIGEGSPFGRKMTIQPISFRFFNDSLFARKSDSTGELKQEFWAEIFFVDDKNSISYIMFNNSSARALQKLVESLYYDDLELTDLVLSIGSEKKENEKGKYFTATFEYELATPESVEHYAEMVANVEIYSGSTIQPTAEITLCSNGYPSRVLGVSAVLQTQTPLITDGALA